MQGQRGREGQKVQLVPHERPNPPPDLTPEQAQEWRVVVNRLPPDWFPAETHSLLAQYCRHAASARGLAARINAAEAAQEDAKDLERLLKMHDREGKAMSSLATRMRITQQSSYDAKRAKGAKQSRAGAKLWEE